jgi:SAM-dependent methyltransferase
MSWDRLRSSYDHVAGKYEERFVDELHGKPRDRELLDAFAGAVGDPALEVGSGPGQIGAYVRRRGRHVIGIDLSPEMAKLARNRLDSAAAADLRALPLRDGAVAAIVAFYTLIHLQRGELPGALREFRRALRPGGRVLMSAHEGDGEI